MLKKTKKKIYINKFFIMIAIALSLFVLGSCRSNNEENEGMRKRIEELENANEKSEKLIDDLQKQLDQLQEQYKNKESSLNDTKDELEETKEFLLNQFFDSETNYEEFFDWNIDNLDFSYVRSNEENEMLFSEILSGQKKYSDYLTWFQLNPDFIYRYNEERFKCVEAVIRLGEFSEAMRQTYGGFVSIYNSISTIGKNGTSYGVNLNADFSVKSIFSTISYEFDIPGFFLWHISLPGYTLGSGASPNDYDEVYQFTYTFHPNKGLDSIDYVLTRAEMHFMIDSVNEPLYGHVSAVYESEVKTSIESYAEKKHISYCKIYIDNPKLDTIYLYTEKHGAWNLAKVREMYRKISLTPNLIYNNWAQFIAF